MLKRMPTLVTMSTGADKDWRAANHLPCACNGRWRRRKKGWRRLGLESSLRLPLCVCVCVFQVYISWDEVVEFPTSEGSLISF